ncbi:MAG: FAD-dependent oxidoreductase [Cypionkella sp.]
MARHAADYVVVGGGFYGCCLALFLRSISQRVVLIEAGDVLLGRASRVNQARVHTGFHYPRSALTAVKSMILHDRFARDFPEAVRDDFQMLYAIARRRSKVSAKRFYRMFRDLGAPIAPASAGQAALFSNDLVEEAFACREMAFDYSALRTLMQERLGAAVIDVRLNTKVEAITDGATGVVCQLSDGTDISAAYAFNVTYAQINDVLAKAALPPALLKYEVTEIALVTPPDELAGFGITVMDGPFFSCMPYPAEALHSLTHVRYTPQQSWVEDGLSPYDRLIADPKQSQARHMVLDSKRYVPALADAIYQRSLYEVKAVLLKNERDDGRPILYQRSPSHSRVISILGAKIDNIYDLFDLVRQTEPEFKAAQDGFVLRAGG